MNSLPLPSRSTATPEQTQNFNALSDLTRLRMGPQTSVEAALCDQIVIALWHMRIHRSLAGRLDRQIRKVEKSEPNSPSLKELRSDLAAALWQTRRQKNFAWRRRGEYWALRLARHEENRTQFSS